MRTQNWLKKISSLFLMMAVTLSVAQPGMTVTSVSAKAATDDNVIYDPLTGALAFVGSEPGQAKASALADPMAQAPATNASAFTSTYAKQLGLNDVSTDLTAAKTFTDGTGRSTVRYQQNYQGIPVFAGEVIVNTDTSGAMLSLTAKTSPNLNVDIHPTLTAEDAAALAIEAVAKYSQVNDRRLTTGTAKLQIYDSRLLNPDGAAPRLVWNLAVSDLYDDIHELVLVDAHNGAIALHYNQMDSVDGSSDAAPVADTNSGPEVLGVPQISVYTLNHTAPSPNNPTGWPGTLVCDQSNKTACDGVGGDDADATNAYLNALGTYNFLKNYLKIDSLNKAGLPIKSSIHYSTGYKRVSWLTGLHLAYYGDGYAGADDMAGHAIGFGLLEFSSASALVMAYQPGAIAESLADMWGEFVDQTNGRGTDTAAVKWIIGEDWPDGAQRSMINPAASPYNDADKMTSANFYLGDDNTVGIYTNAGVNNKAVQLMTDGGTFNGKTVAPLGIAKVARLYYEVETRMLASASTYFDLYYAIKQACYNLVATSQGLAAQDCDHVRNAIDAVQMNLTRAPIIYPVATFCPTGLSKGNLLFNESFEGGTSRWKFLNPNSPANQWKVVAENTTAGHYHLEGPEPGAASKAIADMATGVVIPSGHSVYLFFEHWFNFESIGSNYHDGGVLYYSPDNGVTWKSAAPLFASGQNYKGVVATAQGNPIEGQSAFVGGVRSFVSSSYNLTSLAGKQVKFRWIMASDNTVSGSGWYIDNIQIYPCVSLPSVPTLVSPANNALMTSFTPSLDWSDATPDLARYYLQVATNTSFSTIAYQGTTTLSRNTPPTPLAANTTFYWRVRAYNASNDANGWSAVRSFRTPLAVPTLQSPITGTAASLKPTFNWTDVAGAGGYSIQVSTASTFTTFAINATIATAISQYTPTANLLAATTYYWRVRTNGTNGPSPWSAAKSFKTP